MSNSKKYIILYYISFLVTVFVSLFLDSTITIFSANIFMSGLIILSLIINLVLVVLFSIFIFMKRKLMKTNLLFPITYLLFLVFVLLFSVIYDDRLILSVIHYHYYFMFVLVDYLLFNIYSVLSFKKKVK